MDKVIYSNYKPSKFQNILILMAALVYIVLLFINNQELIQFSADPNDGFIQSFHKFYDLGGYDGNVEGYSLFYNGFVSLFYFFTHDSSFSFFAVNIISQAIIFFISLKLIFRFKPLLKPFYLYSLAILTGMQVLNLKSYNCSFDDSFLGVFIVLIVYLVFEDKAKTLFSVRKSILIGLFFAIALSIRPTIVVLFFSFGIIYILYAYLQRISIRVFSKFALIVVAVFVFFTSVLHFPSLIEKSKLAFYDKNPSTGANWTQRNYLGLKKIQSGEARIHRDVIWVETKFDKVNAYLDENGEDSLPDSFISVLITDPILLFSISLYNFLFCLLWEIRFYGLFAMIPLIVFFSKPLLGVQKTAFLFLLLVMLSFSIVCFTFIEMRWLTGYQVLIALSIIFCIPTALKSIGERKIDVLVVLSLIIVSICNFKTIMSLLG